MLRALALLLVLLSCAAPTLAQEAPAATRAEAERHHRAAVAAFAHRQYREAIEQSTEADHLLPSPANSYNIARAYEAMDDSTNALSWYRDYLQRYPRAPDRAHVLRKIALHEHRVADRGVQQVAITSTPTGARVWIDDENMGVTPWNGELKAGNHAVRLVLPGYDDASQLLAVSLEHPQKLDLTLEKTTVPQPVPRSFVNGPITQSSPANLDQENAEASAPSSDAASYVAPKPQKHGHTLRTIGIVSLAGGALGLGGALAFEVMRRNTESDARAENEQLKYAKELDSMRGQQTAARVLAAIGGTAALGGIVLIAVSASSHNQESAPRADLSFACSSIRSCGLDLRGRY